MSEVGNQRYIDDLKIQIEKDFDITVTKKGQSFLIFPSELLIHVRGSKILSDIDGPYGFYGLHKNNFEILLKSNKSFFAIVYNNPQTTFLIPKNVVLSIFNSDLMIDDDAYPRWYFYIRLINNKYYIDFRKKGVDKIDITNYCNKWKQIDDLERLIIKDNETFDNNNIRLKKQSNTWIVRAGEKGEQEESALSYNIVAIGWNELPDLSSITDKYSLTNIYYSIHKEHDKRYGSQAISQIWNFLEGIKKNDIVILPSKKNDHLINIGIVESEYKFKELEKNIKHIRYVRWLKNIPISDFEQDILIQLRLPKTVYKVNTNTSEAIINLLKEENLITTSSLHVDTSSKFSVDDLVEIMQEFKVFLNSESGQKHVKNIVREKLEVKELVTKLDSMPKNSQEFIDWVLYGLLPIQKQNMQNALAPFLYF